MDARHDRSAAEIADALGDTRAGIWALKAREAELRQALLDLRPNEPVSGTRFEASIRETRRRVLDRDRLPIEVLRDARYWKTSLTQTVVCRPHNPGREAAPEPRREAAPEPRRETAPEICREAARDPGREAAAGSGRAAARNTAPAVGPAPGVDLFGDEDDLVLFEEF